MTQRMMELVRTLGQVSRGEEELLVTLCGAARKELAESLKEGVTPNDCPEAFVLAGAWLALAGLEISRSAGEPESFSAGDVTVRSGSARDRAQMLRRQAKQILSGWTKDDRFVFYGVTGV